MTTPNKKDNAVIANFMEGGWGGYLYHYYSWDALMPVVNKINQLYENPFTCKMDKYTTNNHWRSPILLTKIHNAVSNVKIEETYKAVVAYIKNLNKYKSH